jgi:hypothetical protein
MLSGVLGVLDSQIDTDLSKESIAFLFKVSKFNLKNRALSPSETSAFNSWYAVKFEKTLNFK